MDRIPHRRVGPMIEQEPHHRRMALLRGLHERRLLGVDNLPLIDARSRIDEQTGFFEIAVCGRHVELNAAAERRWCETGQQKVPGEGRLVDGKKGQHERVVEDLAELEVTQGNTKTPASDGRKGNKEDEEQAKTKT